MGAAVTPHSGIRTTTLVLAAVATTTVAWLVLHALGGEMPNPGWVGIVVMVLLAAGLAGAGWQVRKLRDGRSDGRVTALSAARTLVLAQAAALTGSVLVGWYAANVLVLLPDADVASQRTRLLPFVVHAIVALGLAAAGMVVQLWCRVRPRDGEDDDPA